MIWKSAVRRWSFVAVAALYALLLFGRLTAQNTITEKAPAYLQGLPVIRNYPPEVYAAHNQNWAAVQDRRGVMYFGNSYGVLEYDGVSWRLIKLGGRRIARSLAIDAGERIFVGGYGDLGYLAPDEKGQLKFVSLMPEMEERHRNFTDVWQTISTPDGVYFLSSQYIFRWDGRKMHTIRAESAFQSAYYIYNQLFVFQTDKPVRHLVSNALKPVPAAASFSASDITAMIPLQEQQERNMLIATRGRGIFQYDGQSAPTPFLTEAQSLLAEGQVFSAIALSHGRYAFGTMLRGVVITDARGRLLQHLNKASGLLDDAVLCLYEDRQQGLWTGLQTGIARAETGASLSYFREREGMEGSIWDMARHEGRLWLATIMGLYYLDDSPAVVRTPQRIRRMPGVSPQCWSLAPFGSSLLAAAFDGIYEIKNGQSRLIFKEFSFAVHRSQQDSNRLFVGLRSGVKTLYYTNGQWKDEGRLEGVEHEIRHFYEAPDGRLWLIGYFEGPVLADFSKGFSSQAPLKRYDTKHGLPPADRIIGFPTDRGLRFATLQGVFAFDEARQRFYRDSTLVEGLSDPALPLFHAARAPEGHLWLTADNNAQSGMALWRADGKYEWRPNILPRIAAMQVFTVYPDPQQPGIVWIGGTDELVRHDAAIPARTAAAYPALIREMTLNGDSLLYAGTGAFPGGIQKMRHSRHSLRFRYAAPGFDDETKTVYQYQLEGYDDDWSDWSAETYKDYTGIPAGLYRFRVRAKNLYDLVGEAAEFEFRVLPPFYLSVWAWLCYALLFAGLVWLIWKLQMKQVEKRHILKIKQLEFEKLKELDQLKSRFFADISHEFRTPLTLILGPLEQLSGEEKRPAIVRHYQVMESNARRLLRLINQLLDLSRLEAGKMQLDMREADVLPLLKGCAFAFESLSMSKNIRLQVQCDIPGAVLPFDRDKMEQVFTNLISNALKFTPEGGAVQVRAFEAAQKSVLRIEVSDTGVGIAEEQLPLVFERFFQSDATSRLHASGSGIGLALTKELTQLHGGHIGVDSRPGQGSVFFIELPVRSFTAEEAASEKPVSAVETLLPPSLPTESGTPELNAENTLLLVEDNPDMRVFIRDILADKFRVIEAADGQEGLEKALEHIPDLIVSDVMMPRMDGLELCDALKNDERSSHIPIVLLTAKADLDSRIAGLRRGADDYLAKPFHREELLLRAGNLLLQRQRLRERYASLEPLPAAVPDPGIEIEDAFLLKIRHLAEPRLTDADFDIDQLAKLAGMSRSQMFRKIKALTGKSPSVFIRDIRLQRAQELLRTTTKNVTEIAYEVGFSTPAYFSDAFVEAFGVRPSQFKA
ncbi:MAG TPA: hybrid sensor histidine kinase/response regulator transcription factor [Saprospiraceae bacterium]|nr:hybrid sensor histidine kinase/response regulator transcription factor [Saprospiraceae bacterium]